MSEQKFIRRTATLPNVFFGEGYYDFSLKIGQLEDLQDLLDVGPAQLVKHLTDGTWRVKHVTETIRLGLIGAGMEPKPAFELVKRTIKEGNLFEFVMLARTVVAAALIGPEEDPPGETKAATETMTPPTLPEESDGLQSTSSQAQPDTTPNKSEE